MIRSIRKIPLVKGFTIVLLVIFAYFSFVFFANFLLSIGKSEIKGLFRKFGVNLEFSKISVSYNLNLYFKDVELSASDLLFHSEKLYLQLDPRKAILGRLPIRYINANSGNIRFLVRSSVEISNMVDYDESLARFLGYAGDLVLDVGNFRVDYIDERSTNSLVIKKLRFRALNGKNFLFDVLTTSGVSLGKFGFLAKADLLITGLGTLVGGKLSALSGKVLVDSLEVFGVRFEGIKDFSIVFFGSSEKIVGTGFGNHYQVDFEFLRSGTFNLNVSISDILLESNHKLATNNFYVVYKNTDLGSILSDVLRGSSLRLTISNGFVDFDLRSSNTYAFYSKVNDVENFSFVYTNFGKSLRIDKFESYFVVSARNLNVFGNDIRFLTYLNIGTNGVRVSDGSLYINGVYFDLLRGLKVHSNYLVVTNNFFVGEIDLSSFMGNFRLRSDFVSSVLKAFGINLPLSFDGYVYLKVMSDYISAKFNFSSLVGDLVVRSNKIDLRGVKVIPYGLELDGEGAITNAGVHFRLLTKLGIGDKKEAIPINLSFSKGKLKILGRDRIFIDGDLNNGVFDVSFSGIRFGEVELRSLSFVTSLNDKNVKGKIDVYFSGLSLRGEIGGSLKDVKFDGYLYSESRSLKVLGEISFNNSDIVGKFRVDNSTFVVSLGSGGKISVSGQLNKLYIPNLLGVPTRTISGDVSIVFSLGGTNVLDSIVYANGYLVSYLNGLFYKSDLSFFVDGGRVNFSANLYNYFNVVGVKLNFPKVGGNVLFSAQVFPRLRTKKQFTNYVVFNGVLENGLLVGKVSTRFYGFSGLNEVWDKELRWSGRNIELAGGGDGLNFFLSGDTLVLSYVRNGNVIYSASGGRNVGSGDFEVVVNGVIPLEFLLIPDFITKVKGLKLVLEDFKIAFSKNNDFKLFGKAKVLGDSIRIVLLKDDINGVDGIIVANGKEIGIRNVSVRSGSSVVYVMGSLDINNISNPFLDLVITNKGYVNAFIDIGDLKIEGKASFGIRLSGFSDNPYISGVVNFSENSKVYYFLISYSSSPSSLIESDVITYNFAQILNFDNFVIRFDKGLYFKSEIIEGSTKSPYSVQIKGSVFKNTLSLSGDFLLEEGKLNYLGRVFDISEVKLVFPGREMYFVPYVIGEFYRYSFDSLRNEQVKIIMKTSGSALNLNPIFSSEPELQMSEIARILGFSITSTNALKEGFELLESIGVYEFVSYIMKSYTGLDVFSIRSPFVSSYLFSVIDRNYSLSYIDVIRGTEISIGKSIFPWLIVGYRLGFEYVGSDSLEGQFVPLHSFSLGWTYRSFLLELEYSSFASGGKKIEYEPKIELKFNRRF